MFDQSFPYINSYCRLTQKLVYWGVFHDTRSYRVRKSCAHRFGVIFPPSHNGPTHVTIVVTLQSLLCVRVRDRSVASLAIFWPFASWIQKIRVSQCDISITSTWPFFRICGIQLHLDRHHATRLLTLLVASVFYWLLLLVIKTTFYGFDLFWS